MLSCISPHLLLLLKKLFRSFHDTKMEGLLSRNFQSYNIPVFRMKASSSHDSDLEEVHRCERIFVDGDFLSYIPNCDNKVGVYIANSPLTPDSCYYETEIIDTGMECAITVGLCSKQHSLDVQVGWATESVGLTLDDGRCWLLIACWKKYVPVGSYPGIF